MDGYSIGQLAKAAGVATSTVRYYERSGLLKADFRTGGNYRGYTAATLDRLRFIRSAQASGFVLADVEELLRLTESSERPCDEVLALMQTRLAELREKIGELRRVEKTLATKLAACCKGKGPDLCDEIARLKDRVGAAGKASAKNWAPRA
jgi:DNA-binding transcriptional MerR regulator